MSEYPIYEHDHVLPSHYDLPVEVFAPARDLKELWTMICAMQERGLVVLVRAMKEGDDEEGERLVFSTHPDTITMLAETPGGRVTADDVLREFGFPTFTSAGADAVIQRMADRIRELEARVPTVHTGTVGALPSGETPTSSRSDAAQAVAWRVAYTDGSTTFRIRELEAPRGEARSWEESAVVLEEADECERMAALIDSKRATGSVRLNGKEAEKVQAVLWDAACSLKMLAHPPAASGVVVSEAGIEAAKRVIYGSGAAAGSDDAVLDQVMEERDDATEIADRLAAAIVQLTVGGLAEEVIGEHSNSNDPWENALELADNHTPPAASGVTEEMVQPSGDPGELTHEPVSDAYTLPDTVQAIIDAAAAYEKKHGAWQDYRMSKRDDAFPVDKTERAIIVAYRQYSAALTASRGGSMADYPEVATGVAPVYFYGTRRFLTKRGAFEAKARDMMRGDEHGEAYYDAETGVREPCDCFACRDGIGTGSGPAHKAITRALMRGESIPAEYAEELPTPTPRAMTTSEQRESDAGEAAAKYAKLYHDCRAQLAAAERERDELQKFAALQDAWELEAMGDITALFKERNELRTRAERAEAETAYIRRAFRGAVESDALAITYQTIGSYRAGLLKTLNALDTRDGQGAG